MNLNISVSTLNHLHVRETLQDGTFHRYCLHPGQDLTSQPQEVIDVANATWTPEVIAAYEASLPPVPTPEEQLAAWRATADCSALQAEIVIHNMGLTAQVDAIKADPETPIEVKLALEKAYRWSRKSPLWDTFVGPSLSMTPEQIDDLFRAAQAVEV